MGMISKIEQALGNLVEKPFSSGRTIDPESLDIAIKRVIENKQRIILDKVIVPNQISITVPRRWLDEWGPFVARLKNKLQNELLSWMRERGYEPFDAISVYFDEGTIENKAFDVEASFVKSSEMILAETPDAVLATLVNEQTGQLIAICKDGIIGRGKGGDVRIDDPSVSWNHARITIRQDAILLEDLGSTNGTRINRTRIKTITKTKLNDGDRITFGNTTWICSLRNFIKQECV